MPAPLRGIACMVVSTVCFAVMHVAIRYVSRELEPAQIAFFRNLFGVFVFVPVMWQSGLGFLRTSKLALHGLRAVLNVAAMIAFFTALSLAPVAQVTALGFTAPLFAAVLSVIILGERFRLRRWSAIFVGFIGALIILRPGMVPLDTGSLLVIFAAAMWGFTLIVIKVLGRTESSLTITGYMVLLLSILSFVPALFVWKSPTPEAWAWLVFIGITGTLGQILVAQSLKETETSVVMPFDFLKLVWAAILGYLFFAEIPDQFVWIGAAIVFVAGFYIAWRERRVKSPTPVVSETPERMPG